MDNYPEHLAPEQTNAFEKEPFVTWWDRVKDSFPNIPKNVARQWLYRHWGTSSFGYLKSDGVSFKLEYWNVTDLKKINVGNDDYVDWGRTMFENYRNYPESKDSLIGLMQRKNKWPAPPIVLDNTDTHINRLPSDYLLVEGNTRMALALALLEKHRLKNDLPIWIMRYEGSAV